MMMTPMKLHFVNIAPLFRDHVQEVSASPRAIARSAATP